MLFQQPDLLPDPNQRVSILFLLYEMYRSQPVVKNPFAPLFVQLLSDMPNKSSVMDISKQEKMFLYQLVTSQALTRDVSHHCSSFSFEKFTVFFFVLLLLLLLFHVLNCHSWCIFFCCCGCCLLFQLS